MSAFISTPRRDNRTEICLSSAIASPKTLLTHRFLKVVFAICVISFAAIHPQRSYAQDVQDSIPVVESPEEVHFSTDAKTASLVETKTKTPFFSEISVGVDLLGAVLASATSYGQYEATLRLGIKRRIYPVFEAGIGVCDRDDEVTGLRYKTRAPYFRIGADYNFVRRPETGNRIYGGIRVGYSPFTFDLSGPPITDPVWGDQTPFHFEGISTYSVWGEAVFGFDTRLYKFIRLGWSVRYRLRLADKQLSIGTPWYIPGFGAADDNFAGTVNLSFAI